LPDIVGLAGGFDVEGGDGIFTFEKEGVHQCLDTDGLAVAWWPAKDQTSLPGYAQILVAIMQSAQTF
jgi:hypothetical protein